MENNIALVWDIKSGEKLYVLSGHTDDITLSSFSPKGDVIVTGSYDKTAKIWTLNNY